MTRALRQRHRAAIVLLAIALPAGVVVAVAARPVLPPVTPPDAPATRGAGAALSGSVAARVALPTAEGLPGDQAAPR